jgi:hypothetical protein
VAPRQAGGLQRQHQAHHRRRQRLAHAHAVAADQVALQRGQVVAALMRVLASLPKPVLTP